MSKQSMFVKSFNGYEKKAFSEILKSAVRMTVAVSRSREISMSFRISSPLPPMEIPLEHLRQLSYESNAEEKTAKFATNRFDMCIHGSLLDRGAAGCTRFGEVTTG